VGQEWARSRALIIRTRACLERFLFPLTCVDPFLTYRQGELHTGCHSNGLGERLDAHHDRPCAGEQNASAQELFASFSLLPTSFYSLSHSCGMHTPTSSFTATSSPPSSSERVLLRLPADANTREHPDNTPRRGQRAPSWSVPVVLLHSLRALLCHQHACPVCSKVCCWGPRVEGRQSFPVLLTATFKLLCTTRVLAKQYHIR
jgi:hypothetical protein